MTQLAPNNLHLDVNGMRSNRWIARPEFNTPIDTILTERYWAHVSSKLRIDDEIRVVPEDRSYSLRLEVRDVGKLFAKVSVVLGPVYFNKEDAAVKEVEGYDIKWRGPVLKYGVVRGVDVLKDGFIDKASASAWITELMRNAA